MILRTVVSKVISFVADSFIRSPLEQDFGAASDADIKVPDSSYATVLPLGEVYEPLIELYSAIQGLSPEHVKKIGLRLKELPVGKFADYRYQVKDCGVPVELQVLMTKHAESLIEMHFRSSGGVIGAVAGAFGEEDAG